MDFVINATEIENPNLSGNFKRIDLDSKNSELFSFSAEVVFYNSYGSESEYLTDEEIEKRLSNKKCIPCKIVTDFCILSIWSMPFQYNIIGVIRPPTADHYKPFYQV